MNNFTKNLKFISSGLIIGVLLLFGSYSLADDSTQTLLNPWKVVGGILQPKTATNTQLTNLNVTGVCTGCGSGGSATGTPNQIGYFGSDTNLTSSSTLVYLNGNAGIGTSTPNSPLTVFSDASLVAGTAHLMVVGDTGALANTQAQIAFSSTSLGSVLRLQNSAVNNYGLSFQLNGSTTQGTNLTNTPLTGAYFTGGGVTGGLNFISVAATAPILFATGGSGFSNERLRILGTGQILIGTTTPRTATLFVQGTSTAPTLNPFEIASSTGSDLLVLNPKGGLYLTNGTLSGGSVSDNFLNVTGALPSSNSAISEALRIAVTGAGSSAFDQYAQSIGLLAGYTGSKRTIGLISANTSAGTGVLGWTGSDGNYGAILNANGTTAGHNIGSNNRASGSSSLNLGQLAFATSASNSAALNVGSGSLALNGTVNIGFFAGLMATAPTFSTSSALIADNGATGANIFQARVNGVVTTVIDGSGKVGIATTTPTEKLDVKGAIALNGTLALWADSPHVNVGVGNSNFRNTVLPNSMTGDGIQNTYFGDNSLDSNTNGFLNAGFGDNTLGLNTDGYGNGAFGSGALASNTTGFNNVGFGPFSLITNTTGSDNVGIGFFAGGNIDTGSGNMLLGSNVGGSIVTGSNNIIIGANVDTPKATDVSNTLNIGNTIYGTGLGSSPKIGISTSTPDSTLDVNGSVRLESASSTIITSAIGGIIVGTGCDSATTSIDSTIASSTSAFITTPQNDPGTAVTNMYSFVSSPGVLTTRVCGVGITPNTTSYVVKMIR